MAPVPHFINCFSESSQKQTNNTWKGPDPSDHGIYFSQSFAKPFSPVTFLHPETHSRHLGQLLLWTIGTEQNQQSITMRSVAICTRKLTCSTCTGSRHAHGLRHISGCAAVFKGFGRKAWYALLLQGGNHFRFLHGIDFATLTYASVSDVRGRIHDTSYAGIASSKLNPRLPLRQSV